jgi:hypothetical protein
MEQDFEGDEDLFEPCQLSTVCAVDCEQHGRLVSAEQWLGHDSAGVGDRPSSDEKPMPRG